MKAMRRDYEELMSANGCAVAEMCFRGDCRAAFVFDFGGETDSHLASLAAATPEGPAKQGLTSLYLLRQAARHCFQHGISVAHLFLQHALFAAGARSADLCGKLLRETYAALAAAYEAVEEHEAVDHPKFALLVEKLRVGAKGSQQQRDGTCVVAVQHLAAAAALVPALAASGLHTHFVRRRGGTADVAEGVNIALNEGHDCILCTSSDVGVGFPWERFESLVEFDGTGTCSSFDASLGEAVRTHGLQHYLVRIDAPTVICDFIREEEQAGVDRDKRTGDSQQRPGTGPDSAARFQQAQPPHASVGGVAMHDVGPHGVAAARPAGLIAGLAPLSPKCQAGRDDNHATEARASPARQEPKLAAVENHVVDVQHKFDDEKMHPAEEEGGGSPPPAEALQQPTATFAAGDGLNTRAVADGAAPAPVPRQPRAVADGTAPASVPRQQRDARKEWHGVWPVVANNAYRQVGGASMSPLPARRRTYRHLVGMDGAGEISLVERLVEKAFDLALSPSACAAIIDANQVEGIVALARDEIDGGGEQAPDAAAARATSEVVVHILSELFIAPLSYCFDTCHVIIEGHRDVLRHWPDEADVYLAMGAASLGATATFHRTSGQDATGILLKALVAEEARAAAGSTTVAPPAEVPPQAETEMLNFRCLNPLSANAILSSGLSVDTLLSLPTTHQQRQTGMSERLLRHLAAEYAPVRAFDDDMRGDEAQRLEIKRQRRDAEARREDQERRLREAASRSDGSPQLEKQIQAGAVLDEALRRKRRAEAQLAACAGADAAPTPPYYGAGQATGGVHGGGGRSMCDHRGNDMEALGLLEDYGHGGSGMADEAFQGRGWYNDGLLSELDEDFLTPLPGSENGLPHEYHTKDAIPGTHFGIDADAGIGGRRTQTRAQDGSGGDLHAFTQQQPHEFDSYGMMPTTTSYRGLDRVGSIAEPALGDRATPPNHSDMPRDRVRAYDDHAGRRGESLQGEHFRGEIAAFDPRHAEVEAMLAEDDYGFLTPLPDEMGPSHAAAPANYNTTPSHTPSTWLFTPTAARVVDDEQRQQQLAPQYPHIDAASFGAAQAFARRGTEVGAGAVTTPGSIHHHGRREQASSDDDLLAAGWMASRARLGTGRSIGVAKKSGRRHSGPSRRRDARPQQQHQRGSVAGVSNGRNSAGTFGKGFRARLPHPGSY